MQLISQNRSFGGWHKRYRHRSDVNHCDMIFAIYLPPQAEHQNVPVVYWLSGLTCTDENFMQKAGAQRIAAELGIALVCPDTSPRGVNIKGEDDEMDIGTGAGFYLNATEQPWAPHYQMYDYIVDELPALVKENFAVSDRWSISGHSMGGHGAITVALKNPGRFYSLSAFAPICHPTQSSRGPYRFEKYLGSDTTTWEQYDACLLVANAQSKLPMLVDQGDSDDMIDGLMPQALIDACKQADYPLTHRMQKGYDHGYYFVATFIEEHLRYHAKALFTD